MMAQNIAWTTKQADVLYSFYIYLDNVTLMTKS